MKRMLLALAAVALLGACDVESDLPEASGKAELRAINAVPTSGEIAFLIEERNLDTAKYKEITRTSLYDDLTYNFNFDVFYAGETELRRAASQFLNVIADTDYTFVISGSLSNPTVTLYEDELRTVTAEDNVFAAKFLHLSPSSGALDFYFAGEGVAPASGESIATLSNGELSTNTDFDPGDYVITLTTSGDPADIIYQSEAVPFAAGNSFFITLFDGDANDNSPLVVQALPTLGAEVPMRDPSFPPTVDFVNVSLDLGASDIYDDEALTSLRVVDHDYLDVAADVEIVTGLNEFYYTPTGNTSAVTLEGSITAVSNFRHRFYALGLAGDYTTDLVFPDRKSLETMVKLTMYNGASNFERLDLYVLDAGETVDDNLPFFSLIERGVQTGTARLTAGSYDIYITEFNDKTVLSGPNRIDVVLGDIVDFAVVDTVDPAVLDLLFFSGGS